MLHCPSGQTFIMTSQLEQLIIDVRVALDKETDTEKYRLLSRVLAHLESVKEIQQFATVLTEESNNGK